MIEVSHSLVVPHNLLDNMYVLIFLYKVVKITSSHFRFRNHSLIPIQPILGCKDNIYFYFCKYIKR